MPSSASRVGSKSAPRGSASLSGPPPRVRTAPSTVGRHQPSSADALLLGLGEVHPLQVEAEAGGRHLAPEAAEQVVVAAAAAEDVAEGRVVDLEDRAGVVAEVAQQARGPAARGRRRPASRAPRRSRPAAPMARSTAPPPSSWARSSTLSAPPRRPGSRSRVSRPSGSRPSTASTSISSPTRSWVASRSRMRSRGSPSTPSSARSWRYRSASPRPTTARFSPTASSAALSTSITSAVPSGASGAEQLHPGVHELAHLGALRAHGAVGVADVGEAQRRLGVRVAAGGQAGDRDRHVGAQRQQLAALVEEAVGADAAAPLAALQHLVVLERRASPPGRSRAPRRRRPGSPGARAARASRQAGCPGCPGGSGGSSADLRRGDAGARIGCLSPRR